MPDRYRDLIAGARDIVATVDVAGVITSVNPAIQSALGLIPAQIVGSVLWEIIHPRDIVAVHDAWRDVTSNGGRRQIDFEMQDVAGAWHRFEATLWWLEGAATAGLVATDVTTIHQLRDKLRERDDQLRQALKMEVVGRLASGIAHDFGNLLTIIIGASGHLLDVFDHDTPVRTHAESIHVSAERAARLVRQLLDFGRQSPSTRAPVDVHAVVMGCRQMLDRLLGEHIVLDVQGDEEPWLARVDRTQIEQVVLNLAANARDAMPQGGTLTIRTRHVSGGDPTRRSTHGTVVVSVADTGVGMDAATMAHAFEPFFTTKAAGKGTGLGLANAAHIVRENDGWIELTSVVSRGTTVTMGFPRVLDDLVVPTIKAPAAGGSETVLVVEDEAGVRGLACDFLELAGYRVLEAALPSEAERVSDGHDGPVALLLTDVVMPEMSGLELATRLRSRRPQIRVLFMSGYPEPTVGPDGGEAPGAHFLAKPFDRQSLLRSVREAIDAARALA